MAKHLRRSKFLERHRWRRATTMPTNWLQRTAKCATQLENDKKAGISESIRVRVLKTFSSDVNCERFHCCLLHMSLTFDCNAIINLHLKCLRFSEKVQKKTLRICMNTSETCESGNSLRHLFFRRAFFTSFVVYDFRYSNAFCHKFTMTLAAAALSCVDFTQ